MPNLRIKLKTSRDGFDAGTEMVVKPKVLRGDRSIDLFGDLEILGHVQGYGDGSLPVLGVHTAKDWDAYQARLAAQAKAVEAKAKKAAKEEPSKTDLANQAKAKKASK